jgi:hypothetical protein
VLRAYGVSSHDGIVVAGDKFDLDLDGVERFLDEN